MRASRPTAGDLRGLAFEHGAVPSAVVQLEDGRARIKLANARFAALAGDDCEDRWLDEPGATSSRSLQRPARRSRRASRGARSRSA
jgi:hypothetical protein